MKIAIISSCSLPVPAVNGGAVESLVESIVKENELQDQLGIDVFAIYEKKAMEESKQYPHTRFVFLKKNRIIEAIDRMLTVVLKVIRKNKNITSKNYVWKLCVISELKRKLLNENYDRIVLQNTIFLFDIFKDKQLFNRYLGKIYFHVHNSLVKRTTVEYREILKRVISISDYLHPNIRTFFDNDVDIVTVHNGIECSIFDRHLSDKERIEIKEKYDIPKENLIIVFVGRITQEKGIREVLDAFARLDRTDCDLLVVGASYFGSGAKSIFEREVIREIEKNPRIHMTGYLTKNDVWKMYAVGNVAVLPSMWEEPLGLTMIEAQAAGIPLITTKSGGISETVDSRYSILLDKNADVVNQICRAITEVLNNQSEWEKKALLAKENVKKRFNNSTFYRAFVNALDISENE